MGHSPTAEKLLDSAETRVRVAGYNGFSFRDLAADLGIKSASVHHHFPTKEALVIALTNRYSDRFMAGLANTENGQPRIKQLRAQFRASLEQDRQMCLCGMLGAEIQGLPTAVVDETKSFFKRVHDFVTEGLEGHADDPSGEATRILARLEGALILGRAMDSLDVFDTATEDLLR